MQKKPSKKKRTLSSKSKQRVKKMRAYNESNCSLLQDGGSITDLFKNEALKKKGALMQNTSQINFNSTINNYTSVYTVISSSLKPEKVNVKSTKNIISGGKGVIGVGQKKKAPTKQKSKSKLGVDNKDVKKRKQPLLKSQNQRSKHKQQKLQSYELIPQSKNSLNSEIVFSTQQTKREQQSSQQSQKRRQQSSSRIHDSLTRLSQEHLLMNNNKMLRSTIRQQYKRKNEAATKIQKVFRGYLTRRILQKYIKKQQQKLLQLLNEYQSSSQRQHQFQQFPQNQKQQRHYPHKNNHNKRHHGGEFFSSKISATSNREYSPETFQDQQSINLSKINPSQYKFNQQQSSQRMVHSNRFFSTNNNNTDNNQRNAETMNCEDDINSSIGDGDYQIGDDNNNVQQNQYQQQQDGQYNDNREQSQHYQQQQQYSSQQQQQQDVIAYRHHDVIYDRSQIQQYLQSSSQDQDQPTGEGDFSSRQKQQRRTHQEMINKNQIIFQTNQQHIQSRKNSLLNKQQNLAIKKKLSKTVQNSQQQQIMFVMQEEQQPQHDILGSAHPDLIKTSKVNSIHNHSKSHRTSYREQNQVELSPRKKQLPQNNKQDPTQKTSKKQCKKATYPKPIDVNMSSNDDSSVNQLKKTSNLDTLNNQNLQTIKILNNSNQKYQPKISQEKKAFMDTISYNSQFKSKHKIDTSSLQKVNQKKMSLKKKIYYFSDSSDHQQNNQKQYQEKELSTPSKKSQKSSPRSNTPNELQRLKNSEMQRWDEVIRMISCQLGDISQQKGKSKQFQGFIKQVMDLSLKNKEMLQQIISQQSSNSKNQSTFKNSRIDKIWDQKDNQQQEEKQKKLRQFKDTISSGRRKSITQQDIAVFKPHSRILLSSKANEQKPEPTQQKSKPSFFKEQKQELKEKINKIELQNMKHIEDSRVNQFSLLNNIQNDQIEQMLKVRQQMLQKRQCEELTKLNQKLIRKQITQKDFLQSLSKLTENFQSEKHSIDKARQDITKGYNAAVKLIKEAFCDAKKVGYKMPLSKSSDCYKLNKHLGFNMLSGLNNVIIDELNSKNQLFAMKHLKLPQNKQKKKLKSARQQSSQRQQQALETNKKIEIQLVESKYDAQGQQFYRSQKESSPSPQPQNIEQDYIPNTSNTFSHSSSSIINNLSSPGNSFVKHFYEAQMQPKHQTIQQAGISEMKNNVFYTNNMGVNNNGENNFDDFGSEESEEVEFSQQELRRFRKAQPYDPSIADLNKNLMIGKEFFQMQKTSFDQNQSNSHQNTDRYQQDDRISNSSDTQFLRMRLYREVYEIQENDHMEISSYQYGNKTHDPKIDFIVDKELQFLFFQVTMELLMKPLFSEKFLFHKRQQMFGIKKVSDDCRKQFIEIVQEIRPKSEQLFHRVNQNISPLPKQLLKCMRIDFSEQDDENQNEQQEYEQIGKYEMILDQQLCSTAIEKYHEFLSEQKQNKIEMQILTGDNVETVKQQFKGLIPQQQSQKAFAYLEQRQKFVTNRKQHCESIRWQFINMELHCLFDAWNEQIIEIKNNRNGFSGIGLNELTLSMIDRNQKVKQFQIQQMMTESKFKLMKILNYEEQIIEQINRQIYQNNGQKIDQNAENSRLSSKSLTEKLKQTQQKYSWVYVPNKEVDEEIDTEEQAKWIYYSDQALSYGLELVYLVEEELFGEMAKQIRRLSLKGQLL